MVDELEDIFVSKKKRIVIWNGKKTELMGYIRSDDFLGKLVEGVISRI